MITIKDMFGIKDIINYIKFLRHKEELDRLIVKHLLSTNPKCIVCGFKYNTIECVYEKLPIISLGKKGNYKFVCNECRKEAIDKIFRGED